MRAFLATLTLIALLAIARWSSAGTAEAATTLELPIVRQGARVTVRAEEGLERHAARAASSVNRRLRAIEMDLEGLPRSSHIEVRLVKQMTSLRAVAPAGRGAPAWAAGVAWPGTGVLAVAARGAAGEVLDVERTLAHELAHLALDHALGEGQVPRWLTEGFAYLHSSDFSWGRAQTLMSAVVGGRIVPIGALEGSFPAREDEAALAYAQSYDFVAFLARRGRWEDGRDDGNVSAFRELLGRLAAGAPLDAAAQRAFGRTLVQLEGEWLETLRTRYLWYPIGLGATFLWVFAAMLLVLGWLRRRRQGKLRLRQWELEEALKEVASAPPDVLH